MKILAGSSNPQFAKALASQLNLDMVNIDLTEFANGERRVWIKDKVRSENIVLVQSFSEPTDSHIIETLLIVDALERLGVRHVNLVIPWFGYSFQDKAFRDGEPISAKVVANLVSNTYIKRTHILDVHNTSVAGFFSIPTEHLSAQPVFESYIKETFNLSEAVIASPDFGGLKRSRSLADALSLPLVNIDKNRDLVSGEVTASEIQGGSVEDKIVILYDDAILGGSTTLETCRLMKARGAKEVHFLATHGLMVGDAFEKIIHETVDSVVITNTIQHQSLPDKVITLDVSSVFAESIADWV